MKALWSKEKEKDFFIGARKFAEPEQLFYLGDDHRYYAYWPKDYKATKRTLQSRNAWIGDFTEKWCCDLLDEYAQNKGCFVIQSVVCDELGLSKVSPADVAICRTNNKNQKAEDILVIIEVKMSIVWNWELKLIDNKESLICLGDYKTHQGNPGLLRSDTVLKAIGKSLDIRISTPKASKIPIIILGNTPITSNYYEKVDKLKKNGIIQGFWSVNPEPLDEAGENIKKTDELGFCRFDTYKEFLSNLEEIFGSEREFFAGIKRRDELGKFIEIANKETTYDKKAEKFLSLIRE